MRNLSLLVGLCLLAIVCGEDEEDVTCACVDPNNCVNGYVIDGLPSSAIEYKDPPCNGVKTCCSVRQGATVPSTPNTPSGSDTYESSSGTLGSSSGIFESSSGTLGSSSGIFESSSGTLGSSSGTLGSSSGIFESSSGTGQVKMRPPSKAKLQGCGIRRFNGSQPKLDLNMIRVNADDPENDKLTETFYGELPWLIRILVNGDFACGGSLISNQVVLTAAHCIDGKDFNELSLVAGDWNAQADVESEAPQKRSVAHVVKHEQFKFTNGENDVALLFADRPFTLTATVDLVCYPDSHKVVNQNECYAAGWGKGQENEPGYSPVLRKIHMPILDRTRCQTKFRSTSLGQQFVLLPGFMCAGGTDNRDTCKGDGGGPLYCTMRNEPNRFAVIGVISWGIDCGKGNPTVCASVPYYFSWISKHIQDWPNFKAST